MTETINVTIQSSTLIRILLVSFLGFLLSMVITPIYTTVAYRRQWWKKARTVGMGGVAAPVYQQLHDAKPKRKIPTMAGMIFVMSVAVVTFLFNLDRSETWLPLAGMLGAGAVGLIDDYINIHSTGGVAGMKARLKFFLYSVVAGIGGWWFFAKLGATSIYLPWLHQWHVGIFIILIFWLVVIATANAVNISDGLDGLAGGLLTTSFAAYAVISAIDGQYALAAFCLTVVGALLSYTWFNIAPARFYMGDVGAFALGTALGIIALQTDTIYVLPIIGVVYVMEAGSVIINRTSRKLRNGKKVFLSSPVHYHFKAIGWPDTKVTMRFWVIGQVAGVLGLVVFLLGRQ